MGEPWAPAARPLTSAASLLIALTWGANGSSPLAFSQAQGCCWSLQGADGGVWAGRVPGPAGSDGGKAPWSVENHLRLWWREWKGDQSGARLTSLSCPGVAAILALSSREGVKNLPRTDNRPWVCAGSGEAWLGSGRCLLSTGELSGGVAGMLCCTSLWSGLSVPSGVQAYGLLLAGLGLLCVVRVFFCQSKPGFVG